MFYKCDLNLLLGYLFINDKTVPWVGTYLIKLRHLPSLLGFELRDELISEAVS